MVRYVLYPIKGCWVGEASSNQPSQWEKDIYDSKLGVPCKTMTTYHQKLGMFLPKNYPHNFQVFLKSQYPVISPVTMKKNGNIRENQIIEVVKPQNWSTSNVFLQCQWMVYPCHFRSKFLQQFQSEWKSQETNMNG